MIFFDRLNNTGKGCPLNNGLPFIFMNFMNEDLKI